ncbi:hypothetical protein B0H10DRAFT_2214171 [Mycena sp. CBHHK59/15]|nr:hypothetical protein B0H10DRAFT_2214171 [Mycena sp. CBHHK59/15]
MLVPFAALPMYPPYAMPPREQPPARCSRPLAASAPLQSSTGSSSTSHCMKPGTPHWRASQTLRAGVNPRRRGRFAVEGARGLQPREDSPAADSSMLHQHRPTITPPPHATIRQALPLAHPPHDNPSLLPPPSHPRCAMPASNPATPKTCAIRSAGKVHGRRAHAQRRRPRSRRECRASGLHRAFSCRTSLCICPLHITPASYHLTLGFFYTGTLIFSHCTCDLSTTLTLLFSDNHLSLPTLHVEVQAHVVTEMAHSHFHRLLPWCRCTAHGLATLLPKLPNVLAIVDITSLVDAVLVGHTTVFLTEVDWVAIMRADDPSPQY